MHSTTPRCSCWCISPGGGTSRRRPFLPGSGPLRLLLVWSHSSGFSPPDIAYIASLKSFVRATERGQNGVRRHRTSPRHYEDDVRDTLVPAQLVDDCVEVHLARHAPTGRALYLATLALTIAAAAALPIVHVPITVQASGILRPSIERREARAAESGIVQAVYGRDGERVRARDTLVVLNGNAVTTRLATSDSIVHARATELADLTALLDAPDELVSTRNLRTAYRRQQWREHTAILTELMA